MARLLAMRSFLLRKTQSLLVMPLLAVLSLGGVLFPLHAAQAFAFPLIPIAIKGAAGLLAYYGIKEAANGVADKAVEGAITLIAYAVQLVAQIGTRLLDLVSEVLGSVVTIGSFVTNPFVASGWPFLQGLANFGFILALLVIAVTTALRLDIGGGARRLLPRLLLGAILINFSLLIGGLIIDFSRLLMALFANLVGSGLKDLGPNIIKNSQLIQNIFNVNFDASYLPLEFIVDKDNKPKVDIGSLTGVIQVAQATIFIWGLMIGMLVILITLIIRYVMLLLLLIVSPLVYVAIAFPGAGGIAKKWWASFLKNVFYGPIAMFALVMLATVGTAEGSFVGLEGVAKDFLGLIITVILLFVVATSGRSWGAAGANFALNTTKGSGNWLRRNPVKAGALAGSVFTGGLGGALLGGLAVAGAKKGGSAVANTTRDFKQTVSSNVAKNARSGKYGGFAKLVAGPDRDDKGNLKKGETSVGSAAAQPIKTTKDFLGSRASRRLGQEAAAKIGKDRQAVPLALKPDQLSNPDVLAGLSGAAYTAALDAKDLNGKDAQAHQSAAIAGTLNQKTISKDQAQRLVVHLTGKITTEQLKADAQEKIEREEQRKADDLRRRYGATDSRTIAAQDSADKARQQKNASNASVKLAKTQLKKGLKQKNLVEALGDAEKNAVLSLGDGELQNEMLDTIQKKDDDKK